jgi:hypothetical protein
MDKLSTIQKRNNLNYVFVDPTPGPGGGHHEYEIVRAEDIYNIQTRDEDSSCEAPKIEPLCVIKFQKGPRNGENSISGVLDADLLEIVRDRFKAFQAGEYATRENACALTHIEEALMWMNKRVEDRAERNVLGTMNK